MDQEKVESAVEEGIEVRNEIIQRTLNFLASVEEEVELELDGLKLRIGEFEIELKGDVDLKIHTKG